MNASHLWFLSRKRNDSFHESCFVLELKYEYASDFSSVGQGTHRLMHIMAKIWKYFLKISGFLLYDLETNVSIRFEIVKRENATQLQLVKRFT